MTRVLTALVLVPVTLAVVLWAPVWLFVPILAAIAMLAVREFYDLGEALGLAPYRWLGLVATAVWVAFVALPLPVVLTDGVSLVAAIVIAILVRALTRPENLKTAYGDASCTLFAVLYIGLFLGLFGAIRLIPDGPIWLIFLLVVVWVGDTAALYAGRAWGKHKLAPRVSPGKSWEGAAASLIASALVAWGFGAWERAPGLILLGVAINVAAQFGDLVESLLKRSAAVKDSGSMLPGHGGVLDRIDALLLATPALWYYLAFLRPHA